MNIGKQKRTVLRNKCNPIRLFKNSQTGRPHFRICCNYILSLCFIFTLQAGFTATARAQQTAPAKKTGQDETNASPKQAETLPAPVAPSNNPLFYFYTKLGPFTPEDRAERLEDRIRQLGKNTGFSSDLMEIVSDGATLDITYKGIVVMSVSDADAEYFKKSKEEVAEYYKENIAGAVVQYRHDTELPSVLIRAGLVLLILGTLFFIIRFINRFFRILKRKIVSLRGTRIKGINIKSYSLLNEDKCIAASLFCVKIIRYITLLAFLYFSLTLLFSIFPETRGLAAALWNYTLTPFSEIVIAAKDYLPKAVAITVIVTIFRYLSKAIKYFAYEIEKEKLLIKGFYPDWAMPTYSIIRTLLYAFMFIVIFQYLPYSDSKAFQGVSVFLGVLVSLGSTALVGNLISGLVLTYMRPFRVGDFIKVGDTTGTVIEKAPLSTRIVTVKNEEIVIPNSNIMSAHTINYSQTAREGKLILYAAVTVGYDTPWRQIHKLLLESAAQTQHVLKEPAPFVLQCALDNFFVEYQINIYVAEEKLMPRIYSDLYENIQDVFKNAGVDITSPVYQSFRGENHIKITQL